MFSREIHPGDVLVTIDSMPILNAKLGLSPEFPQKSTIFEYQPYLMVECFDQSGLPSLRRLVKFAVQIRRLPGSLNPNP